MIHVVAVITAKPGQREKILEAARDNLAAVRADLLRRLDLRDLGSAAERRAAGDHASGGALPAGAGGLHRGPGRGAAHRRAAGGQRPL